MVVEIHVVKHQIFSDEATDRGVNPVLAIAYRSVQSTCE